MASRLKKTAKSSKSSSPLGSASEIAGKLGAIASSLGEQPSAKQVMDSAQQIWLAGLGAFSKAQNEGKKVFDTLVKQEKIRELSREYRAHLGQFWTPSRADEVAALLLENVGLISTVFQAYGACRSHDLALPSLSEVLAEPELMDLLKGPFSAAVRLLDDFGDRLIDEGDDSQWGEFTLNVVNQFNREFFGAFLRRAGVSRGATFDALHDMLQSGNPDQQELVAQCRTWIRASFAGLPPGVRERYRVFMTLVRRTIEVGYVSLMGDIALAGAENRNER